MRVGTINQMIEDFTRSRAPVDIVAQKDMDGRTKGLAARWTSILEKSWVSKSARP